MIQQDRDYFMGIIRRMVQMILNLLLGRGWDVDDEVVERACETLAGLSIDTAMALSFPSVVQLLTGPRGLEAEKGLMMALGFIFRGLRMKRSTTSPDKRDRGQALVDRGQTLLLMAVKADPSLLSEPVAELMERLFVDETAH